jgi:hypothetical protein
MTDKFRLEEYKHIFDEIKARERSINQLFVVAVVVSVSILSAVSTLYSRQCAPSTELSPIYAYVFLSPFAVILPILYVLISHRRDLHRSGTYIHVFYEEPGLSGPLCQDNKETSLRWSPVKPQRHGAAPVSTPL